MKQIVGFLNYQISCGGDVVNSRGHELKSFDDGNGYLKLRLRKDGQFYSKRIARLVAEAFVPNPLNLPEVNHLDGNKLNNFAWNLEWSTRSQNQQHAFDTGLQVSAKGSKHHNAKLTESDVLEIRAKYIPRKYPTRRLAREYGVSQHLIMLIIHHKFWTHI